MRDALPSSARRKTLMFGIAAALAGSSVPALAQDVIDLATLDDDQGFVISGAASSDRIGHAATAIAAARDFNGDGIDDILIGSRIAENVQNYNVSYGATYIVFGSDESTAPPTDLANLNQFTGVTLYGSSSPTLGASAAAAGDVNGDGITDVIAGAPISTPANAYAAGTSYVLFGTNAALPAVVHPNALDGFDGFALTGIDEHDRSGHVVGGAGDFNGDGFDDVIIGAPRYGYGQGYGSEPGPGESYIVFGKSTNVLGSGPPSSLNLSALNGSNGFVINGIDDLDESGGTVGAAGDINDDGRDDVLIVAPGASVGTTAHVGEAYLVFGKSTPQFNPPSEFALASLNGSNGVLLQDFGATNSSIKTGSPVGDFNGDGFDDFALGAPFSAPYGIAVGQTYVVFGGNDFESATFNLGSTSASDRGWRIIGAEDMSATGASVAAAGDVNGDGVDDLIIGAPRLDPASRMTAGGAYVVFGRATTAGAEFNVSRLDGANGFVIQGRSENDLAGTAVAGAGDVNNDGLDDLLISAPGADPLNRSDAGEVYVLYGNAAPRASANSTTLEAVESGATASAVQAVQTLFEPLYVDNDPIGGVAVVIHKANAAQGVWQYSFDAVTWSPMSDSLSDEAALVLDADAHIRFAPKSGFVGQPDSIVVRLWDGRWRDPGDNVSIESAIGALGGFANDDNLIDVTVNVTASDLIFANGF